MQFDSSKFWVIRLDSLADTGDTRVEVGKPAENRLRLHRAHNRGQGQLIFALVQPSYEEPDVRRERREDHLERRERRCRLSSVEQAPISISPDEVKRHSTECVPSVMDYFFTVCPLITHVHLLR